MDKYQLAEWMHNEYEVIAKAEKWQTQKITRVKFDDLPAENKATMLALADKMLNTFKIISLNPVLCNSLPIEDIDAEMVKRWYQKLIGIGEEEMKVDIRAMAKAAELHRELKWL